MDLLRQTPFSKRGSLSCHHGALISKYFGFMVCCIFCATVVPDLLHLFLVYILPFLYRPEILIYVIFQMCELNYVPTKDVLKF